jgi:hypothetical protein
MNWVRSVFAGKLIGVVALLVATLVMLFYVYGFSETVRMLWNVWTLIFLCFLVLVFWLMRD